MKISATNAYNMQYHQSSHDNDTSSRVNNEMEEKRYRVVKRLGQGPETGPIHILFIKIDR